MTDAPSPLQAINRKESELRRRVEAVRAQAETQIQREREEAERLIAQADRAARAEAEVLYQRGIDEARREVEGLVTKARDEALALHHRATVNVNDVAARVVDWVIYL